MWVGLRPLVKPQGDDGEDTKALSREHTVLVSRSGLVTVTGGKWTTYRAMAEDVLEKCFDRRLLERARSGVTTHLKLVGAEGLAANPPPISQAQGLHSYGSEAAEVQELPGAKRDLGGGLTEAMVRFAARHEYARTAEDMLARRWRLLFLDARQASSIARKVGDILAQETGVDPQVEAFQDLARLYLTLPQ
jgi:glycerol-3-phosphate dehydrogenase